MNRKFPFPVHSFRRCFGILNDAKRCSAGTLERCCKAAVPAERCHYTYIANTITSYVEVKAANDKGVKTKPKEAARVASGVYKDDDEKYSMANLLKNQEEAG